MVDMAQAKSRVYLHRKKVKQMLCRQLEKDKANLCEGKPDRPYITFNLRLAIAMAGLQTRG